ncbi:MAG: HindIII family type II restriction endonuclease [Candidatus Margulisbacteria bacterium]|jgi:type II restriction enzyme|nr:HindIII family type II restriction endonuclease [Candidatus Margulisiibacteriota bacterium]
MSFLELCAKIKSEAARRSFEVSTQVLEQKIYSLNRRELLSIVAAIGAIPENIGHDSTEEKLYAKASDIVLAKCLRELGLSAVINKKRANCADVVAKSMFHGYSLVGEAKSFRLSRTAKNQKDFKVKSLADWRGDNNYAVLTCPYYQYPKSKSQIYGQALNDNVSLFSWEYFSVLLANKISENKLVNFADLWNCSFLLAKNTRVTDKDNCFLLKQDAFMKKCLKLSDKKFEAYFSEFRDNIVVRGNLEIKYWQAKIMEIKKYTRKQAIKELLLSLKLNEKISAIRKYIDSLEHK